MRIINTIQFAVVREDPEVESTLISQLPESSEILLIGSGGCTALTISSRFPTIVQTLLEPNKSQIELINRKVHALSHLNDAEKSALFGIEVDSSLSLTSCGNFESLFKNLRLFMYEFVMEREDWLRFFSRENSGIFPEQIFSSRYWPVAFQLFFSDSLLISMFGDDAVQHASGPYPAYFQKLFENGLRAQNAKTNYFLHHVFLGHYINDPECLPAYLSETVSLNQSQPFRFENVLAQNMNSFAKFDLLSFSNIFDWMKVDDVKMIAAKVAQEMKPGAWLIYRQLNNDKNFRVLFGNTLKFDDAIAHDLHNRDRSLFYSGLHIAQKQ